MIKNKLFKLLFIVGLVMLSVVFFSFPALAAGGETAADQSFNEIIKFLARWVGRVGMVIAFVGAVMFGFGVRNDDGDGKAKGVKWIASGVIVFAVTLSLNLFGIN